MAYVEVHTLEQESPSGDTVTTYKIVLTGADTGARPSEVIVTNATFIDPIIGELGVRSIGPWEPVMGDGTHDVQRASVLGLK